MFALLIMASLVAPLNSWDIVVYIGYIFNSSIYVAAVSFTFCNSSYFSFFKFPISSSNCCIRNSFCLTSEFVTTTHCWMIYATLSCSRLLSSPPIIWFIIDRTDVNCWGDIEAVSYLMIDSMILLPLDLFSCMAFSICTTISSFLTIN